MMSPDLLTVEEVAALLRCSTRTLYAQAKKGRIPGAIRVGSLWRFNRQALENWMSGARFDNAIPG